MAVMAQNRFRSVAAAKRQDSFHWEGKRPDPTSGLSGLAVPEQQVRRHSTGNVTSSINIEALQPNLENLQQQEQQQVYIH